MLVFPVLHYLNDRLHIWDPATTAHVANETQRRKERPKILGKKVKRQTEKKLESENHTHFLLALVTRTREPCGCTEALRPADQAP